jgi:hypothetical protein
MASSRQNVFAISNCLRFLKNEYEFKFKKRLFFRILVTNYSWASMHAALEARDKDSIHTNANARRIFCTNFVKFTAN